MSAADAPATAPREVSAREILQRAHDAGPAGYALQGDAERAAAMSAELLDFVRIDDDGDGTPVTAYMTPNGYALVQHEAAEAQAEPAPRDPIARVRAWVAAHVAPRPAVTEEELCYALHLAATADARHGVAAKVMPRAFGALADTGLVERFEARAPFARSTTLRVRAAEAGRAYLAHIRATMRPPERVTDVELRRMLRDASHRDGAHTGTPLRFAAALALTAAGLAEPLRRTYTADTFDVYATEAGRAALVRPPWTSVLPDDEVWNVLAFLAAPAVASHMPPRARVALDALCNAALAQRVPDEHEAEARYQRTAYGAEEIRWHRTRQTADEAVKDLIASPRDIFRAPYAPPLAEGQEAPAPRPDGIIVALLRSLAEHAPGAWAILSAGERCALPVLTAAGHAEEDNWQGLTRARITDAGRARLATLDDGASVAASIRAANAETTARRDAFLRECIDVDEVATDVLLTAVRRFAARACPSSFSDAPIRGGVSLADESDGTVSAAACIVLDESGTRLHAGACHGPTDREALRDLARQLYDHTPAAEGSAAP